MENIICLNFIRYTPKYDEKSKCYVCVDTHSNNYLGEYKTLEECKIACQEHNKEYKEFFLKRYNKEN